ncbi:MAG: hypothetical protein ACRC3H_18855 [Lachnospiraceae bacterium]
MGNAFWEQFVQSGKVDHYLNYREEEACQQIADEYAARDGIQSERKSSVSDKNGNRNST